MCLDLSQPDTSNTVSVGVKMILPIDGQTISHTYLSIGGECVTRMAGTWTWGVVKIMRRACKPAEISKSVVGNASLSKAGGMP